MRAICDSSDDSEQCEAAKAVFDEHCNNRLMESKEEKSTEAPGQGKDVAKLPDGKTNTAPKAESDKATKANSKGNGDEPNKAAVADEKAVGSKDKGSKQAAEKSKDTASESGTVTFEKGQPVFKAEASVKKEAPSKKKQSPKKQAPLKKKEASKKVSSRGAMKKIKDDAAAKLAVSVDKVNKATVAKLKHLNRKSTEATTVGDKIKAKAEMHVVKTEALAKTVALARKVHKNAANKLAEEAAKAPPKPKHVAKKPFIEKERILQKFKTAVKTAKVKVVKKKKKLKKEKSKKEEPKVEKEAEKKPEVYVKHGSDLHKAQSGDKGKTTYYHKIGKVPASVKKQTEAELRKHAEKVASAKVEKADE